MSTSRDCPEGSAPPAEPLPASSRASDCSRYPLFRPGDLLIAVLLAAPAILFLHGGGTSDATVLVAAFHGGEARIQLPCDTSFTVQGVLGPVTVEVSGSRARIGSSPCPGQYCVRRSWLSQPGEVSVCAPSGVWIRLEGDGEPDAVSY